MPTAGINGTLPNRDGDPSDSIVVNWRDTADTKIGMVQDLENAVPILDKYGVEMVISGHDKHYVRSYPLNGIKQPGGSIPEMGYEKVGQGEGTVCWSFQRQVRIIRTSYNKTGWK